MVPGIAWPNASLARIMPRANPPEPEAFRRMSRVTCSHRVAASTGSDNTDAATMAACWFHRSSLSDKGLMSIPLGFARRSAWRRRAKNTKVRFATDHNNEIRAPLNLGF
jgi:ABC-type sugar transport system substrate-binding protein